MSERTLADEYIKNEDPRDPDRSTAAKRAAKERFKKKTTNRKLQAQHTVQSVVRSREANRTKGTKTY